MGILWTIIIGFVAGVIAKFIMPGDNEPSGFILTAVLGIIGAFVATYLGQALGWYGPGQGAGLIGAVVGVQPFGGEGLSGTGPKAGGPNYLRRFALERTFTVNTAAAGGNAALLSSG